MQRNMKPQLERVDSFNVAGVTARTTNRDEIEHALDLFERNIVEMRGLLTDPEGLELWMAQARDARRVVFP